jgi:hypothetical protein
MVSTQEKRQAGDMLNREAQPTESNFGYGISDFGFKKKTR